MEDLNKYKDIIKRLNKLDSISPDKQFKSHFEKSFIRLLPSRHRSPSLLGYPVRFALIIFLVVVLGASGTVLAAEKASPGSIFYPVKKITQDIKLIMATNSKDRAAVHLKKAEDKVKEIEKSASENKEENLEKTVEGYEKDVRSALEEAGKINNGENQAKSSVEEALNKNKEVLENLKVTVPTQAQPAINKAIEVSSHGQSQAGENNSGNSNGNKKGGDGK